jgi:predicted nucleic acid-binding protein
VSGERSFYLDSSAIVKLVLTERESGALRAVLASAPSRVSCTLARVEVVRAVRDKGPRVVATARRVLEGVDLIELDNELLEFAADLAEPLRSLDAIHVAAAMELGDQLEALVTYDAQMTRAAESLGLPVLAPA